MSPVGVPSLNNIIVISECSVPSGSTHVFVPDIDVLACFIVFVKLTPFSVFVGSDVYPETSLSFTS